VQSSNFTALKQPSIIVLSAGHGEGDPGVVYGGFKEENETVVLTDLIAFNLQAKGVEVRVVPHSRGLKKAIKHINDKFDYGQAWAIEIHRDSADNLKPERASKCCGVYQGTSQGSTEIGRFIRQVFLREGCHSTTWARPHTQSRHGKLGWVADTNPLAHLLELGFIQGSHAESHMKWLAKIASIAIYEAFTGLSYHVQPGSGTTVPGSLLTDLTRVYATTNLKALFQELSIQGVDSAHYSILKEVTLAQWILESARPVAGSCHGQHFQLRDEVTAPNMQAVATSS
jgi:hypothetical protein